MEKTPDKSLVRKRFSRGLNTYSEAAVIQRAMAEKAGYMEGRRNDKEYLRVFAEALDGNLYHYRDSSGLECDAVLHRRNGTYGLIEVKLGGERLIEEGAANLRKLVAKLDLRKMRAPSFQMVLVAEGKYAYRRKDGVLVVPVGCLGV